MLTNKKIFLIYTLLLCIFSLLSTSACSNKTAYDKLSEHEQDFFDVFIEYVLPKSPDPIEVTFISVNESHANNTIVFFNIMSKNSYGASENLEYYLLVKDFSFYEIYPKNERDVSALYLDYSDFEDVFEEDSIDSSFGFFGTKNRLIELLSGRYGEGIELYKALWIISDGKIKSVDQPFKDDLEFNVTKLNAALLEYKIQMGWINQ